jgi:outer membrane protein assembly factor BamB
MNRRLLWVVLAGLSLTACDTWMGEKKAPPLPGKRVSVLSREKTIEPEVAGNEILLPPPDPNDDWPQAGGLSNHAMHHMEVEDTLAQRWSTSVGSGSGKRVKILAQPIVAEGRAFTLDADSHVTAVDIRTGDRLWRVDTTPKDYESSVSGGGLAYEDGRVFAATGFAQVVALDARKGKVLWRQNVSGPMRGSPTVRGGRVFVVTVDNQTHALSAEDGSVLWTHSGTAEAASLLSGNSPAVDGNVVVVPYSSGEIFALRVENGGVLWQDQLATVRRTEGVASLSDIGGRPIIDRGKVYAVGHSDMMVAIDLRTGRRLWEREIGGLQSPWLAGDYLYEVTNNAEVVCMEAKTGKIMWVTQMQAWENMKDKDHRIVWAGPVLASDRLILGSSNGKLVSLSPYTGELTGMVDAPNGITIAPAVAGGALYFLTDDADLVAYR